MITSLCPKCQCTTGRFNRFTYVPARKRGRVWYAPWRFTEATPETMVAACATCGYVYSWRPGTCQVTPLQPEERWR